MIPLHGYSLIQFRRFLALAEELHFSRTAEQLGISQPLLSEQIRDLEAQLQVKLFNRSSRRVELTPAGQLMRDRIALILLSLEEGIKAGRELHGGGNMPIRIGYTDEYTNFLLPGLVAHVRSAFPKAEITLLRHSVPDLVEMLNSGLIDLALLCPMFEGPPDEAWEVQLLPSMALSVGLAADHPLAAEQTLSLEQLAHVPFIECRPEPDQLSSSEVLTDRLFARRGLRRQIVQILADPHLAASLAAAGVGALFTQLPASTAVEGLAIVPLVETDAILTCGAVWRSSNQTALLKLCLAYIEQFKPTTVGPPSGGDKRVNPD